MVDSVLLVFLVSLLCFVLFCLSSFCILFFVFPVSLDCSFVIASSVFSNFLI